MKRAVIEWLSAVKLTRPQIENVCITVALLGLCIFFELRGNREALLMTLAAFLALWKHSGRRRKDDGGGPPKGAAPGTVGGAAVPAVLVVLALAAGCTDGVSLDLRLRGASTLLQPAPAPAQQQLGVQPFAPIRADVLQLTPQAPGGIVCESGKVCVAASSSSGQAYFIDSTGAGLNAGEVRAFQALGAAPSGSTARVYYDTVLGAYRFYAGGVFGPLPAASGGTGVAGSVGANRVFAAPDGSSGALSARLLVAADIPNLSAAKITSGALGLAYGGTGLDLTAAAQNAVFAGPGSGGAGAASLRALVAGDIPALPASQITSGQLGLARGGTGLDLSTAAQNQCFCGPVSGGAGAALLRAVSGADITTGQVAQAQGGTGADLSSSAANRVWASPNGSSGAMAARSLVAADLPATAVTPGTYTNATLTVDQQGRLTAASSGGGGGGITLYDLLYDVVTIGTAMGWLDFVADYTYGGYYQVARSVKVTGARAYTSTTSGTLTAKLWVGGSAVASGTASITAAGIYTITFGSPYTLTAGQFFRISAREGTKMPYVENPGGVLASPGVVSGSVTLIAANVYAAGDNEPVNTSGGTYYFGVSPTLAAP